MPDLADCRQGDTAAMRHAAHRRPTKRAARSPLEGLFASLPALAALPIAAVAVVAVVVAGRVLHYSAGTTSGLAIAVFILIALAAANAARDRSVARKRLVSTRRIDDLRGLTPAAFEGLVLSAYEARGWRGSLTQRGADGGVDVILQRDGERMYVQCKRWRDRTVRPDAIRSLKGVMAGDGVSRGVFVSSGRYTAEALRIAASYSITAVDGHQLLDLIRDARGEVPGLIDELRVDHPPRGRSAPFCPRCHVDMVVRSGSRGRFWGCPRYPTCRGTRPL